MAGASAGSLVVSLGLDAARYTQGLTKAQYQAQQFARSLSSEIAVGVVKAEAAMRALGEASAFLIRTWPNLIDQASNFQGLADKTGASAEGLASLAIAAGSSGVAIDQIAQASIVLTKNLTGVDDESKAAGAALKALGLNIDDFKKLKPEDQMVALANALGGFEDGAQKTAVAVALLGKSGAEALPFLKDLYEQGGKQVVLSAEMIAQADEYAKKQATVKAELNLVAQALAIQAIPAMTAFQGAIGDTIKELLGLDKGVTDLKNNKSVQEFAENAVKAMGFVIDAVDGVVRAFQIAGRSIGATAAAAASVASGDFSAAKDIASEGVKDVQAILDRPLFSNKLNARLDQAKKDAADAAKYGFGNRPGTQPLPTLNFNGAVPKGGGGSSNAAKKSLDDQLKLYENAIKEEQDLLQARNRTLDLYNNNNLISIRDYYAGKRAAQQEAVAAQIALYDQELAALQAYQSKAGKAEDRASNQIKINELLDKKVKLQRDSAQAALEMGFAEQKANEAYQASLNELNAKVLELNGNLVQAANIRFDAQNADLLKRSITEGNEEAVKQIAYLKQINAAQAAIGQTQEKFASARSDLQRTEERIARDQELGIAGQIDGLVKLGEARKKALAEMQKSFSDLQALQNSGAQLTDKQKESLASLSNEIADLSTRLDPLAEKFNTMFGDAASSAFGDFINGTKTAKEAFNSFINDITNQLIRMAAQDVFKSLFSGGGSATGGVGFDWGSLLSGVFGKAGGGLIGPGSLSRVNENGPELLDYQGRQYLMNGNRNARIASNDSFGGGSMTTNITIPVTGQVSYETKNQIANNLALQQRQGGRYR